MITPIPTPVPSPAEYCLLGIDHWSTCMQKSEWASWIQAVFSIIAICAAIGIAWWQRHSEQRRDIASKNAAATVAGVSVFSMLSPLIAGLKSVREGVLKLDEEHAIGRARRYKFLLDGFALPTDDQMLQLHSVLPSVAEDLALGAGTQRQVVVALGLINDRSEEAGGKSVIANLAELEPSLANAERYLRSAQGKLHAFLRK